MYGWKTELKYAVPVFKKESNMRKTKRRIINAISRFIDRIEKKEFAKYAKKNKVIFKR